MASALVFLTWLCLGLQAYHYVGYAVVLLVLGRIAPRPVARGNTLPSMTLITAAHNEAPVIAEKIENTLALDYPDLEIVVVSDGSTDGTAEIAERYRRPGFEVIELPSRSGKTTALNTAAAVARGEILVVSDANALCEPDALRVVAADFADPSVGCVSGFVMTRKAEGSSSSVAASEGLYWRYEAFIRRRESLIGSTSGVTGALLAVRRSLFEPIPAGTINDDFHLALHTTRRGFRTVFEPRARCWRRPSRSAAEDAARRRRITAGRYQQLLRLDAWPWRSPLTVFMLFSHKFLRLLLPYLMAGAFAANALLFLLPPVPFAMRVTFAAQLAFYALAAVGYVGERIGRRWRLPALAYYITRGNLSAISGHLRYLTGRQSVLWEKVAR